MLSDVATIQFCPGPLSVPPEERWICTRSGRKFYPLAVTPDQICIEDIAFGLAGKYRFGAQSPIRYTVAQHSVEVCRWLAARCYTPDVCLWGLLHDAAEAWLVDWQRPVKGQQYWWDDITNTAIPFPVVERNILAPIAELFGLSSDYLDKTSPIYRAVDAADSAQLYRERRDLFDERQPPWLTQAANSPESPLPAVLDPQTAEKKFMAEFIYWFSQK